MKNIRMWVLFCLLGSSLFHAGRWYAMYFPWHQTAPALELAAYRECMVEAPRCRMTPQDFVRYHELRHKLEDDDDGRSSK